MTRVKLMPFVIDDEADGGSQLWTMSKNVEQFLRSDDDYLPSRSEFEPKSILIVFQ